MGQEIETENFTQQDFEDFKRHLCAETELLGAWFDNAGFDDSPPVGGFELEAWLVDSHCRPAPVNQQVLDGLDPALYTSELARFNLEINNPAMTLGGDFLGRMRESLQASWSRCREAAERHQARLLMIGILPTLRQDDLNVAAMTPLKRYAAINEQILRQRQGEPLIIDINGHDHLRTEHDDVMLESATTSFQIHTQIPPQRAARYYNASMLVSAPLIAAAANSPFLFGSNLWEETRIPLFEQSVAVGGYAEARHGPLHRVSFGSGYARKSLFECFVENRDHYPVLLPTCMNEPAERLAHLRLHNGTIWRWNRPLIGTENGTPHLRVEQRVLPGGPSVVDVVANAALYFGLAHYFSENDTPTQPELAFAQARDNFYLAARQGLEANIDWMGERHCSVRRLLLDELIPCARQGLLDLGMRPSQSHEYLDLIAERVRSRRNGANWQRKAIQAHGGSLEAMTQAYLRNQESGLPVHEWPI